ncbi:MAG: strawberry notch C-terminal domain-containing protein [Niastella sp.]|nr:strawberry notch C-terminal domain-containing protein [Niastella sp.]
MKQQQFVNKVFALLSKGAYMNKRTVEKEAAAYGITDKTLIKELTELAIVRCARYIAGLSLSMVQKYEKIVDLYSRQAILSHRTSQSILLQQYSTPAPIAYLAGIFCRLDDLHFTGGLAFEPSAGNGLLTIAAKPGNVFVNEIDNVRNNNLKVQGFAKVMRLDATIPFKGYERRFTAVITNPPFGTLQQPVDYEGYKITTLEQLMSLRALDTMADNGKAAIIIGGHTRWDDLGRMQAGRNRIFFNYLYSRYHVQDVININGKKLYTRQGTGFDVRLILIDGRKPTPQGVAPLYNKGHDVVVNTFDELYNRVTNAMRQTMINRTSVLEQKALKLKALLYESGLGDTLEAPYQPASQACIVLDTQVPDSMAFETQSAVDRIRQEVGGDMDNFVRHRLGYPTKTALCKALSAEQIDAVGMAIYNIEARNQGMIIGDQTGIGKGRVAASVIRYATQQGLHPVFLTEKANLFSDIYRDLAAIGSGHLRPFIVNARESKTDIKDEDGNVVYQALPANEQQAVFESRQLPAGFDFVVATYSQFNSPDKKPEKPGFLMQIAIDNIMILDEAHNSSGSSNTGSFLQGVVAHTRGVTFLSATFAKRPDNMPIYAMKTAIADCTMSRDQLVDAITRGGVALQEVLSAQLVAEGQMLRRERSFEGVEVNYLSLDDKAEEHRAIADNITDILRDIIAFQDRFIKKEVEELDKIVAAEGKEMEVRKGTSQAGVDNQPYFSKIFQVINQMLFSLKAEAVAERAIMRLKEGKKPVIAFASTMGSFIETLETDTGMPVGDGDIINADFSEVLQRGLDGIFRYTEKDVNGQSVYKRFALSDLAPEAVNVYNDIAQRINSIATGITISPIDVIIKILKEAGYSVAEVTGRKFELQLNKGKASGMVLSRKKINTNDAFRKFNNNEVDVLMINQSGSTGASAHAIPTAKVPREQVRQRVMIVLQAELDINTEVQKRGRINRTGQILKPIYDYVTSAIPAEKRLMMMLQKKLKSLDANTTSNQKQSTKILDVPDFLNKYGDKIVKEYLLENPPVNKLLDDPLKMERSSEDSSGGGDSAIEDAAHRVSGRVAVLSTKMQQEFYLEIAQRYSDYVEYLQQIGEYDLEVEAMNLQAEATSSRVIKMGNGSDSAFGDDSVLETIKANVLKKPFTAAELDNLLTEALQGRQPNEVTKELQEGYERFSQQRLTEELAEEAAYYDQLVQDIPQEKKIRKLEDNQQAWLAAIAERKKELETARKKKMELLQTKARNNKSYLLNIFRFFHPGRAINYPVESFSEGNQEVPAVFIGYLIDLKKKNPYIPSQIKLRFAIANSSKYLAIPASYSKDITSIIGVSVNKPQPEKAALLQDWETYIKQTSVDRKTRHVITGNLLQAFSDFKGKLVSYTTHDGQVKKGILLPEYWDPGEQVADNVTVPINKALPLIRSLVHNGHITTNNGLSFFKQGQQFKIVVGGSRVRGGDVYLDKDLLHLVHKGVFEKASDKMIAIVEESEINIFVETLQKNHKMSVTLNSVQFRQVEKQAVPSPARRPIELPPPAPAEEQPAKVVDMGKRRRLEMEARALKLKLELLAA